MIPCINQPVGLSCRSDAPCKGCYGKKGRFTIPKNMQIYRNNFNRYLEDPDGYFADIAAWLQLNPVRYFRYHSCGDMVDEYYFVKIVELAEKFSEVRFLIFTKKFEIVNDYIHDVRELPRNLTVVLSAWGDWIPENPYNLPMSYVRFKRGETKIPKSAIECSGYCGECVQGLQNCWNLRLGESVVFNQH